MTNLMTNAFAIVLLVAIFLLSACNSESQEATSDSDSPAADELILSESYTFPGFGYSIDYPAGWTAETRDSFTVIVELESDLLNAFQEDPPTAEGLRVSLEQRTRQFMVDIGLADDASLEDLFEFNKGFFEWKEPIELVETEAFNSAVIGATTSSDDSWSYILMGYTDDRVLLLNFMAPDEQALEDMMPTWEGMLASTRAIEE